MNKKGQALIISLWVLIILTVLAVSIGHRVSLALRLSRYQRERLKSHYLAHTGMNIAVNRINNDKTVDYDTLLDTWAKDEDAFKKIVLGGNPDEYAVVSYSYLEGENKVVVFGVIDEERKINLNTASKDLLVALLEKYQIAGAQGIVASMLIWRGDVPDSNNIYRDLGYPAKGGRFSNIEELKLVKEIAPADYEKIKGSVTVFGEGLLDINTAPFETLSILARASAKELSIAESAADNVSEKIVTARNTQGYFRAKDDIKITLTGDEETNIFNNLIDKVTFRSDIFLIEVIGNAGKIKSRLACAYSRKEKRLLFWHEN